MELETQEEGGRFPREVSSLSKKGVKVGTGRQQMWTSHDAIAAKRDSQVGNHPGQSFCTW